MKNHVRDGIDLSNYLLSSDKPFVILPAVHYIRRAHRYFKKHEDEKYLKYAILTKNKEKSMEDTNTQWHLGLKPAVDLELAEERANLSYLRDLSLNQQALEIDLLIIKKESDQPIKNAIGRLFRN